MDSKLSDIDQDQWFYESLKSYKNLYMFELEFPVDSVVTISETSLCVSGIQNYSKKCEILQLSVPPKLLPKDIEEGLCKDRDFKIISGGYATEGRIKQIEAVKGNKTGDLVAVIQTESNAITLLQLGDDEHALITKKSCLNLPEGLGSPEILGSSSDGHIYSSSSSGGLLFDWDIALAESTKFTLDDTRINKIVPMDQNILAYCSDAGKIVVFDTREGKPGLFFDSSVGEMFTFDYCPKRNIFARADSNGGFEVFDYRKTSEPILARTPLPGIENIVGVLKGKFDLSIEPNPSNLEDSIDFIVPGFKEDVVRIFKYSPKNEVTLSEGFVHGGHMKTVTHSLWHPTSCNLLFSCSIDSMLHAWQYNDDIGSQ